MLTIEFSALSVKIHSTAVDIAFQKWYNVILYKSIFTRNIFRHERIYIFMENTEFLSNDRLKISPRAYALALQNNVDILKIIPTGPEGRIIENDILRAIEERNKPKFEEKPAKPIVPISDEAEMIKTAEALPEEEPEEEEIAEPENVLTNKVPEEQTEEAAEEAEATAESTEDTEEAEEITEDTAEEAAPEIAEIEEQAEEAPAEEAAPEAEPEAEETAEEIPAESAEEPTNETAEEIVEDIDTVEETVIDITKEPIEEEPKSEEASEEKEERPMETAIVTAPVTAIANEEAKEEPKAKEEPAEKTFRSEDAYRHTDVIISQSENAPTNTPITIEMSFDATALVTLRGKVKEFGEAMGLPSVTINDMILFATAKTLKKHKAMNAHFLGDKIRYFDGIHLGFDVDTERGPQTLTVFDADRLSLSSLAKITGTLVRGVRAGGEAPEKNQRLGSFTVTNVGTLGVERFTPVLTEPQTGVLAVCALTKRIKTEDGEDIVYPAIPLALTFDPRAMSTANAAKFLRDLCVSLENFGLLLIK